MTQLDLTWEVEKFQVDSYFIWTEALKKHSNFEDYLFCHLEEIKKEKKNYISH